MVLKTREKIMIGVALLVGVVMGFDQFLTTPKKKEVLALRKQVQESNERLAAVSGSLVGLNQIRKRVQEKRKEKEILSGRTPDDRQLGIVMDQLGKESGTKQVDLIQMHVNDQAAGGPAEDKGVPNPGSFKKVVLDVEVAAGFETIGPFLDNMQSLPIFLEIEKVEIRRKEDLFPKLQVTVQQTLYVSTSPKQEFQNREGDAQNIRTSR
jgi:Tfp pilus assembly protein PilO